MGATPWALLGTATLETFITYGSQSRNAQMAYNVQCPANAVPLFSAHRPWGPGAVFFMLRNFCGMSGIRWLSPSLQGPLQPVLPRGTHRLAADLLASVLTCVVSAPLNILWTLTVTTPVLCAGSPSARCLGLASHLRRCYLSRGSSMQLVTRDLTVRCVYIACCFSLFAGIERLTVAWW